jgi:excisionase family DNA binding protein
MTQLAVELLTIDEAAALLRMSKTTFRRRLDRGEFTVVRDRRIVLVPRTALLDYLTRHTRPGRDERGGSSGTARTTVRPAPQPSRRVRHLWETGGDA